MTQSPSLVNEVLKTILLHQAKHAKLMLRYMLLEVSTVGRR